MTIEAKYFTEAELNCNHCGRLVIHAPSVVKLDELRERLGKPVILNSAYRCSEHDAAIGGAGIHPLGQCFDISIHGPDAYRLIKIAMDLDFTGIGVNQSGPFRGRFVHLDTLENDLRPRVWSY